LTRSSTLVRNSSRRTCSACRAGSAVVIAGPSVCNHWPAKLDLLITALRRGAAALAMEVATVYRQAAGPADALHRLLRSYVSLSHSRAQIIWFCRLYPSAGW
jgi:hypothetical protein